VKRIVAGLAAVAAVILLYGARPMEPATPDPVHLAALRREAASQAMAADAALAEAETLLARGIREGARGQTVVLGGTDDPVPIVDGAALAIESAAGPIDDARAALADLAWTLRAIDPEAGTPTLDPRGADMGAIGAQWRATGLPLAAQADLRHLAEATLAALDDALAALDRNDLDGAQEALAEAEALLDQIRGRGDELSTLPFWVATVDDLLDATADIAAAAEAGDPVALAAARAAYDAAANEAGRADQALTIALGEAASRITLPASATSADALRDVVAVRAALAGLSILP
jgi:hypothetical protein